MSPPNERARRANAGPKLLTLINADNNTIGGAIKDAGPNFVSWGKFKMTAKSLTCPKKPGGGSEREEQEPGEEWISAPFEIIGACRDPSGRGWGKWLRWRDKDGRPHSRHVADAALHGDRSALCGGLADEGLTINRSQHQALVTYLSGASVKGRVTIVQRTGWHKSASARFSFCRRKPSGHAASSRSFWMRRQSVLMRRAEHFKTGNKASAQCRAIMRLWFSPYQRRSLVRSSMLPEPKAAAFTFSGTHPSERRHSGC